MDQLMRVVVRLNPRPPVDSYRMHQAIAAAASGARVLWSRPTPRRLVIQCERLGDWRRIPGALDVRTELMPPVHLLTAGTRVEFGLIANPSKACGGHGPDGGPAGRSRRRALPMHEREAWLARKLDGALAVETVDGVQLSSARGRGITITRHLYVGAGHVACPEALATLVAAGVGPGKGLGCGLLTVAAA